LKGGDNPMNKREVWWLAVSIIVAVSKLALQVIESKNHQALDQSPAPQIPTEPIDPTDPFDEGGLY
jgi:energy-converting hydrogenase Eha subunit F